jgi:hypothetical protein
MNDALARWGGGFQITGTPYDGSVEKNWGAMAGNAYSAQITGTNSCCNAKPPPLHNWQSDCDPTSNPVCADITVEEAPNSANGGAMYVPGTVGSYMCPWMNWYLQYALGREAELGFAAKPLQLYTGQYPIGMINASGYPILTALYEQPVEKKGGGFLPDWPSVIATLDPTWLNGTRASVNLPMYFAENNASDGRNAYLVPGMAMLVDQNAAGAAAAWSWMQANVYSKVPDFSSDPKWAIVPRTDNNVLPPQPTTMP